MNVAQVVSFTRVRDPQTLAAVSFFGPMQQMTVIDKLLRTHISRAISVVFCMVLVLRRSFGFIINGFLFTFLHFCGGHVTLHLASLRM